MFFVSCTVLSGQSAVGYMLVMNMNEAEPNLGFHRSSRSLLVVFLQVAHWTTWFFRFYECRCLALTAQRVISKTSEVSYAGYSVSCD